MKTKLFIILCLLLSGLVKGQSFEIKENPKSAKVKMDLYGRIISDEEGNRINYSPEETIDLSTRSDELFFKNEISNSNKLAVPKTTFGTYSECDPAWNYSIMGTYIGRRSMNSVDIDNDGKTEIICSARPGYGSFWYILRYDSLANDYRQVWVGDSYTNYITCLKAFDINSDGDLEIIIGFDNGKILIFNGVTKSLVAQINLPVTDDINDIEFGDADNDSSNELAASTDTKIYFYNPVNFSQDNQILYGGYDFKIGNVDADSYNEIVTTLGKIVYFNGSTSTLEWTYDITVTYDNSYSVELSDIDSDGMKEVIRSKSWNYTDVYDVNLQALKYEINTGIDVQALLLKDVNNDGIDEILIGDGQWGHVHCFNSVTQAQIWQINNPEHGVTAINCADVNEDGFLEVIWGAGWSSSGADYLYVADISSHLIEWTSVAIDGPFYAIAVDDIDNDSTKEIVTVSYESESGYESGILSVFDAVTKELEWQSDGDFFYQVWTGIYDVKINDIDNDGNKEIIVAAGQTYTGEIWIVDGITKTIESSYIYSTQNLDEFKVVTIEDIDIDGIKEMIVGNAANYYIINPVDFSIEYSSGTLSGGGNPRRIMVENIDNDAEEEIIFCNNYLYVFGGITHSQWQSAANDYRNFDLYDFNGDGRKDIITCTSNGYIEVIDGITLQIISSIQVGTSQIDGIVVTHLNGDTIPEYVFSTDGTLNIYSAPNQFITTKRYGQVTGAYNSLMVSDIDNDTVNEIIFGTTSSVLQLSDDCYQCMWFTANASIDNRSCGIVDDGSIVITAAGFPPYSYSWSNGDVDSLITGLSAGAYLVTVSDNKGCVIVDTLSVLQSQLIAAYTFTNENCNPPNNGTASINITTGTPTYSFQWSNGANTSSVNNLNQGTYTVTVNDSENCSLTHTFVIQKDILQLYSSTTDATCFGVQNGSIHLYPQGTSPYTFLWSTGQYTANLYYIGAGTYSVTVTDAHGCEVNDTLSINQPSEIVSQITTTPDSVHTFFGDGTATVNVMGGTPTYTLLWNDPFAQTTITAVNLLTGTYIVNITDHNGCLKKDTAIVGSVSGIEKSYLTASFVLHPNPTSDRLEISFTGKSDIEIYDVNGQLVKSILYNKNYTSIDHPGSSSYDIDISNLSNGLYFVKLISEEGIAVKKLIKN